MRSLNTTLQAHRRERDLALRRTVVPRQLGDSLPDVVEGAFVKKTAVSMK